jgi:hypothetical protein
MLDTTKVQATNSFKCIAECISNLNTDLAATRDTFTALDAKGYDYFMGNISNRGRYESLSLVGLYLNFLLMIVTYLRSKNLENLAENLLENKDPCIHYLTKHVWTRADLISHKWVQEREWHMYGQITSNELKNHKGIQIDGSELKNTNGVQICHRG